MYISKNPAKSRPLSANVKRLMRLSRAAPANGEVVREARHFTAKDLACCAKQGDLFMEAASMGFTMEEFAPLFMTSQLAGFFDASFSSSAVMDNENLSNLLQIPVSVKLLQIKQCFQFSFHASLPPFISSSRRFSAFNCLYAALRADGSRTFIHSRPVYPDAVFPQVPRNNRPARSDPHTCLLQ